MAESRSRELISIRRRVPLAQREEYDTAWARFRRHATDHGAHAWRFVSAAADDVYMEFLEFAAGSDPRREPRAASALEHLDSCFGAAPPVSHSVEEWRAVPEPEAGA